MAKNLPQVISDLKNGKGVFVGSPLFVREDGSVVDVNEREQFPANALSKAAYDEFEGMSAPSEVDADVSGAISTHNSDTDAHQSIQSDIRTVEVALQQVGSQLAEIATLDALGSEAESLHRGAISNNQIFAPKAAVTMHFDDGRVLDFTTVYPALQSRHLVAGFAVNEDTIDSGASYCTTENLLEMQISGMEIMHHGYSHITATEALSVSDFIAWSATSAERLRAKGLNVQSLVMPGTISGACNEMYFNTEAKLKNVYAGILRRTYRSFHSWLYEDLVCAENSMPYYYPWGYTSGGTIESSTLAALQTLVDLIIKNGGTLCLTSHSFHFGEAGYLSVADFGTFLDYLVTKRDAGLIEVLTPTGAAFCHQGAKVNQVSDVANCTTENPLHWTLVGGATVGEDSGEKAFVVPYGGSTGSIQSTVKTKGYRTVLLKFWAKAPTTTGAIVLVTKTPYYDVNGKVVFYFSTWSGMSAINTVPVAGGSGYAVGDILYVADGSYGSVIVLSVDANGAVTKLGLYSPGTFYAVATKATTGGTGTGCTVAITGIYSTTAQGNTLAVGNTRTNFAFTIGLPDGVSEVMIQIGCKSSGDAQILVGDVKAYYL